MRGELLGAGHIYYDPATNPAHYGISFPPLRIVAIFYLFAVPSYQPWWLARGRRHIKRPSRRHTNSRGAVATNGGEWDNC